MSPFRYQLAMEIFNILTSASDRSPHSLEETGHYIYRATR